MEPQISDLNSPTSTTGLIVPRLPVDAQEIPRIPLGVDTEETPHPALSIDTSKPPSPSNGQFLSPSNGQLLSPSNVHLLSPVSGGRTVAHSMASLISRIQSQSILFGAAAEP